MKELDGAYYSPGHFDRSAQLALLADIRSAIDAAPLYTPAMPRSGKPFSVRMTNCGSLGWVSDQRHGYRYEACHPETGRPWPPIPEMLLTLWQELGGGAPPEACLINYYTSGAKMGMHRDEDEEDFTAPIISVSLGDTGIFRLGASPRKSSAQRYELKSGDVFVMSGDARLAYHGIDRIVPGTSDLLPEGGRINLTLRRVRRPA